MSVSFDGIGQVCATFLTDQMLEEGKVAKVSASGKAAACSADEAFCGVVLAASQEACSVQVGGFVTVPYTGTAPTPGFAGLAADGSGGVKVKSDGRSYLVAAVDTAAQTAAILL